MSKLVMFQGGEKLAKKDATKKEERLLFTIVGMIVGFVIVMVQTTIVMSVMKTPSMVMITAPIIVFMAILVFFIFLLRWDRE